MANEQHLKMLKQGFLAWNKWRSEKHIMEIDLSQADLSGADLAGMYLSPADLSRANLRSAVLAGASLMGANLIEANLRGAELKGVNLSGANLKGAKLEGARLYGANLIEANLSEANLSEANLESAILVETNLEKANLSGCSVYGISAWKLNLDGTVQSDLIISDFDEPVITVDNLEVAQFMHLLINNEKIRHVIDTITSKVVLILGRFTEERKKVLEVIRDKLRNHDYLPVLFDFVKPVNRDLTETVSTLAHMARFIIADLTDPSSIPHELFSIVPRLRHVPIRPIIQGASKEYGMFADLQAYPWVMSVFRYQSLEDLLSSLQTGIIAPAQKKVKELIYKD
jgi:uncharacterized protein YjbI with pentapeptide repeats